MTAVLVMFLFILQTFACPWNCGFAEANEPVHLSETEAGEELPEEETEEKQEEENSNLQKDMEIFPDDDPPDDDPPDDDPPDDDPPDDDPPDDDPPEGNPPDDPPETPEEESNAEDIEEEGPETNGETGETELSSETETCFFSVCFDSGKSFPPGSSLTVQQLTEEDEAWPEYLMMLEELLSPEESLLGIFELSWTFPEYFLPDEEPCLFCFLLDFEEENREGRLYLLEEEKFRPPEDAEWDDGSFFLPAVRPGLIALSVTDPPGTEEPIADDPVPKAEAEEFRSPAPEAAISLPVEKESDREVAEEKTEEAIEEEEEAFISLRASPKSRSVPGRTVYRYSVSAKDLADTEAACCLVDILDAKGQVVKRLTLSAPSWEEGWDTEDSGLYTAKENAILDSEGNDITSRWSHENQSTDSGPYQEEFSGYELQSDFEDGVFAIAFGENDQYLLAASTELQSGCSPSRWPLEIAEWELNRAPSNANWLVTKAGTGWYIRNEAIGTNGYLGAVQYNVQGKEAPEFTVIHDNNYTGKVYNESGHLKAPCGTVLRWLKADAGGYAAVSEDQATTMRLYQKVDRADTVFKTDISLIHTLKPQTVTITVELHVSDNLGERNKSFPFCVTVNGEETQSFSLKDGDSSILEEISVGAELEIQVTAGEGFTVTSAFSDLANGDDTLNIDAIPSEGGTANFRAVRNEVPNTGQRLDDNRIEFAILLAVILFYMIKPFIIYLIKEKKT